VISDTPPTLQPVTISPYARVTLDTQTHSAQTVNIAAISTPAADAQQHTASNKSPLSTITINMAENLKAFMLGASTAL